MHHTRGIRSLWPMLIFLAYTPVVLYCARETLRSLRRKRSTPHD
jgi:hypothetical protein